MQQLLLLLLLLLNLQSVVLFSLPVSLSLAEVNFWTDDALVSKLFYPQLKTCHYAYTEERRAQYIVALLMSSWDFIVDWVLGIGILL